MAGLMDSINKQLQAPSPTPGLGQTEQAAGLLRAKLGKAQSSPTTPAQSNLGEQVAQQTTQMGLDQIGQQSQMAGLQLGAQATDQAQQGAEQKAQAQERVSDLANKFSMQAKSILDELEANRATLGANQQMSKMDQAGFLIRGTNDNYVKELQRQGELNRLANKNDFRAEMTKAIFDDEQELFDSDLKFRKFIDANDRQFNEALANMSDDFAMKMGDIAARQASTSAMFSGASQLMSGGLQAYSASQKDEV